MPRVTSSLPVPLSPITNTAASESANVSINSRTCTSAGDSPTSPSAGALRSRPRRAALLTSALCSLASSAPNS